jgi:hypothetical protein
MEDQQPLPPAPSLGTTFMDVFTSPSEVFQNLRGTASSPMLWVVPFIVTLLIVALSVVTIFTNETLKADIKEVQSKAIQKQVDEKKLTQEQADQAETQMESMGGMMIVFGVIGGALVACLFFFGGALFLWLANKTILHSTAGYGKHLEMYGIASWIGVAGGIITILMMVGLGSVHANPSGSLLVMSNFDTTNHLHKLLSALNIFSIWQTAVIGFGIAKLSEKPNNTGLGIAFALWAVWVAIQVFIGFGGM